MKPKKFVRYAFQRSYESLEQALKETSDKDSMERSMAFFRGHGEKVGPLLRIEMTVTEVKDGR